MLYNGDYTPTITMSLNQFESIMIYEKMYHDKEAELISAEREIALWQERYKEALKMLEDKEVEIFQLKDWKEKWEQRYDSD